MTRGRARVAMSNHPPPKNGSRKMIRKASPSNMRSSSVNRVGRRTIMTVVLIVVFTQLWNLLCHQSRARAAHATKRDRSVGEKPAGRTRMTRQARPLCCALRTQFGHRARSGKCPRRHSRASASFGWRAAFLPLKHTVLFYSLHPGLTKVRGV